MTNENDSEQSISCSVYDALYSLDGEKLLDDSIFL